MNLELENLFEDENFITLPWDGWSIDSLLGEGAYGRIYQISHPKHGRCAVKIVPFEPTERKKLAEYESMIEFMMELKDCKHIVKIFEYATVWMEEVSHFLVFARMELLHPLYDMYDHRELEEEEVVKIGLDLADGLLECQKHGVLHRDIKPGNVLVDDDGVCKLADFGNMRIGENQKSTPDIKGTPTYMAPEVFHGHSYDFRADLYSVGMILYVLLNNGKEPFLNPDQKIYLKKQKEEAFLKRMDGESIPAPLHGSEPLTKVISRCLAFDPSRRYRNANEFKKALKNMHKNSSKKIIRVACVCAALVLCVAFGVVFVNQKMNENARSTEVVDTQYEKIKEKGIISFAMVNGKKSSYKTETIEALCKKLGLEYEIIAIPHKNIYTAVKSGKADCIMCGENEDIDIAFTNTIYYRDLALIVQKNRKKEFENKIKKQGIFQALAECRFALVNQSKAYSFFDSVNEWDFTETTMMTKNRECQKLVSEGRDDVGLLNDGFKIRYHNLTSIKNDELVFRVSIGCAQDGELYTRINEALKELEEEGVLDEIAEKYDLNHKKGVFDE